MREIGKQTVIVVIVTKCSEYVASTADDLTGSSYDDEM